MGNRVIAEHFSGGRILTKNQLQALRSEYRGTPPPTTANLHELTFTDVQDPIAPERVGRRNPLNVVISQLNTTETPTAQVTPNVANKALFDHAYDHITMQILTEAARQLYLATRPDSELAPKFPQYAGTSWRSRNSIRPCRSVQSRPGNSWLNKITGRSRISRSKAR